MPTRFHRIAVVGAGAVGSFYGAMLARSGHPVVLIGRAAHMNTVERDGLKLDMAGRVETIRVTPATKLSAVRGADLVLFCVKSTDTEHVAREMAPWLDTRAVILSLQNGVENVTTIARYAQRPVLAAVVYVATAMVGPGTVKHFGRGDLVIGDPAAPSRSDPALDRLMRDLVALFDTAGVQVTISDDIRAELWSKLLVNCAYNAISALAHAPYARLAETTEIRDVQQAIVHELIALAHAEGVTLDLESSLKAVKQIAESMPEQLSSTAQDLARQRRSEIDHLNGFVARRGRELGVAVPVNQTLHALVKLVEASYERSD